MGERSEKRRRVCRILISERRLVGELFGFVACPNPTWDILLDLYNAQFDGTDIYLSSLSIAAHVPLSSAHRKIQELVDQGWLLRSLEGSDGRRITVRLSSAISDRVSELLDAIANLMALN
jgi:hypothetical protein